MRGSILSIDDSSPAPAIPRASEARQRAGIDPRDFRAVYDRYFPEAKRWLRALGIPAPELDDVAQEVFVVVRRKQESFDGENLPGWLFGIARRIASDHRRRSWLRRLLSGRFSTLTERFEWGGPSPVENLERALAQRELDHALAQMSEKVRTAFVLFEIEGYDGHEVAALLGVPEGTAWTRLRHGRRIFLDHCAKLAAQRAREEAR